MTENAKDWDPSFYWRKTKQLWHRVVYLLSLRTRGDSGELRSCRAWARGSRGVNSSGETQCHYSWGLYDSGKNAWISLWEEGTWVHSIPRARNGREDKSGGRCLVEKLSCLNKAQGAALSGAGLGRVSLRRRSGQGTAGVMHKGHTTLS